MLATGASFGFIRVSSSIRPAHPGLEPRRRKATQRLAQMHMLKRNATAWILRPLGCINRVESSTTMSLGTSTLEKRF